MVLELKNLHGEINTRQAILSLKQLGWTDRTGQTNKSERQKPEGCGGPYRERAGIDRKPQGTPPGPRTDRGKGVTAHRCDSAVAAGAVSTLEK